MKRRELFGSLASSFTNKKQEKVLRPPYFENADAFLMDCKDCEGFCARVCETNIIKIMADDTPQLDFSSNGCTYCDECAKACPKEVLNLSNKHHIHANISIDILKCFSWNQTMCFSCKDPCLDDAIDFLAMFRPEINDHCTACGFCVKVCPADAISIGAF